MRTPQGAGYWAGDVAGERGAGQRTPRRRLRVRAASRRSRCSRAGSVLTIACCLLAIVSSLDTVCPGVQAGRAATCAEFSKTQSPARFSPPSAARGCAPARHRQDRPCSPKLIAALCACVSFAGLLGRGGLDVAPRVCRSPSGILSAWAAGVRLSSCIRLGIAVQTSALRSPARRASPGHEALAHRGGCDA